MRRLRQLPPLLIQLDAGFDRLRIEMFGTISKPELRVTHPILRILTEAEHAEVRKTIERLRGRSDEKETEKATT